MLGGEGLGDRRGGREPEPDDDLARRLPGALVLRERRRELFLRQEPALDEDGPEGAAPEGRNLPSSGAAAIAARAMVVRQSAILRRSYKAEFRLLHRPSEAFGGPLFGECGARRTPTGRKRPQQGRSRIPHSGEMP